MTTKFLGPDDLTVEFSREACVMYSRELISAFQNHTYLARVTTRDKRAMIVILPKDAANAPPARYVDDVISVAQYYLKSFDGEFFDGKVTRL